METSLIAAIDIVGSINKQNLIKSIRSGWSKDTKIVMVNYRGQWYELNKNKVFSKWIDENIK
ncbi:MAG: hypothetical protein LBH84_07760 [Prevotellaceae bacterium]|jgi:hypothetical protein|nr:hypothetical protein [Prevotellaceae bacterium]